MFQTFWSDLLFFLLESDLRLIQFALDLVHTLIAVFTGVVQFLLHKAKTDLHAAQFLFLPPEKIILLIQYDILYWLIQTIRCILIKEEFILEFTHDLQLTLSLTCLRRSLISSSLFSSLILRFSRSLSLFFTMVDRVTTGGTGWRKSRVSELLVS